MDAFENVVSFFIGIMCIAISIIVISLFAYGVLHIFTYEDRPKKVTAEQCEEIKKNETE